MCSTLLLYLILILSSGGVLMDNSLKLLETDPTTYEGGSVFQRVMNDDSTITKCTATFSDSVSQNNSQKSIVKSKILIELDLNSKKTIFPEDFQDKTNLKSRLHSLGSGICGFKIDDVSLSDPTEWTIEATSNEKSNLVDFTLSIYSIEIGNLNTTKEVNIGSDLTITCDGGDVVSKQFYCLLYNPMGELIHKLNEVGFNTKCTYSTNAVTSEDIGNWKCVMGGTPFIKPVEYIISVVAEESYQHEMWLNETNDYISIGCIIKNVSPQTHCEMTLPSGEKLVIQTGSASTRYTSIYTNLPENTCAIEVQKPLLDTEVGSWKCQIDNNGVFIQVSDKKVVRDIELPSSTATDLGTTFQINCQVPYSVNYCFIISPTGKRYHNAATDVTELGECSLQLEKAEADHNGTWTCSFIKDGDVVAVQQKFDVFIRNALKCSVEVSTLKGNEASMYCNTARSALEYCWFTSPTGKTYQLNNKVDLEGVSYIGDGLKFGDCGIKIHNMQEEDVGNWSCIVRMGGNEYVNVIVLDLKPGGSVSLAAGLGAGIGSCIILIAAVAAVAYQKYRRIPESNQEDTASDTSSEIVILSEQSILQQNRSDQLPQYSSALVNDGNPFQDLRH